MKIKMRSLRACKPMENLSMRENSVWRQPAYVCKFFTGRGKQTRIPPLFPEKLCPLLFQKGFRNMIDQSVYWAYVWCFLGGRGRNRFDTLVNDMHQQNGWSAFTIRWFSRPTLCISRLKEHHGYLSVTNFSSRYPLPPSPWFVEIRKKVHYHFLSLFLYSLMSYLELRINTPISD